MYRDELIAALRLLFDLTDGVSDEQTDLELTRSNEAYEFISTMPADILAEVNPDLWPMPGPVTPAPGRACPGWGTSTRPSVCGPEPARDLRNGRATCPVCHRAVALSSQGTLRWHVRNLALGVSGEGS